MNPFGQVGLEDVLAANPPGARFLEFAAKAGGSA
jgi:hypothetical protein